MRPRLPDMEMVLNMLVIFAVVGRFFWPLVHSPLDYLWSDPARHYENAQHFLEPTFMGSHDPFLYQLYLYLAVTISGDNITMLNAFCGVLCAFMPLAWFPFLRRVLPTVWAKAVLLVLAVHPSLWALYGFFMNETLLLVMIGIALSVSFWSAEKGTKTAFALAATCWALASITRLIALPLGLMVLGYLIWRRRAQYPSRLVIVLLCFALVLVWPSIHSYRGWHMLKPFGLNEVNTIYAISGAKTVEFHVNSPQGVFYYIFSSAALYTPGHLQPLSDWQSPRSRMFHFIINPEEGRRDWDRALNIAHENPYPYIQQVTDNMLTFLFAGPWPDSSYDKKADKVLYINGLLRWGWAPLILGMALLFVPFLLARPRQEQLVVVLVTGAMIGAMFLQFTGVMEGRFRKPLEPLMITAFAVMLQMILARRRKY